MSITVTRQSDTRKEVWIFEYHRSHELRLTSYEVFQKEGGEFQFVAEFPRLTHSSRALSIFDVPLPVDVKEEAMSTFIAGLAVVRSREISERERPFIERADSLDRVTLRPEEVKKLYGD